MCRRRRCGVRRRDPCSPPSTAGRPGSTSGWTCVPPTRAWIPRSWARVVAAIHQVASADGGTPDAWYVEPVGADRWDQLVEQLREAGAPFAGRLAELRDELVALESWIEPPETLRTCHRDLWADNVLPTADGGVCVIDWENSGPADPSQELGCVLFEFARARLGPGPRAGRRLPGGRWAGDGQPARTLLDARRAARAHHRDSRHGLAGAQPALAGPSRLPPRGSARSSTNRTPGTCSTPYFTRSGSALISRSSSSSVL